MPWREINNPYFIWLSEIILQQTRVAQGLPYYQRFIETYPTIEALARASEQEVLMLWQGLGYYSRARNLHKCAQVIQQNFGGEFPGSFEELVKLPGIGPYTAAAIASLAFNKPVPVVDGNVYRVLARVFGIENNIADAKSFKVFFNHSRELIDINDPGSYNQAIMELGATVCVPQNPECSECPVETICYARKEGKQSTLPVKIKKAKKRDRYFTYLVIVVDGQLAMKKREQKDIWQGLFEFVLVEGDKTHVKPDQIQDEQLKKLLANEKVVITDETLLPKHLLSHQTIHSLFVQITVHPSATILGWLKQNNLALYAQDEIETLPKPVLITRYLNSISKSINLQ